MTDREAWLKQRQKSIGGSDAAALVGLSLYATQYTVWADKTGRLPPLDDNEAMRQGRDLEDYVAHRFTEASGKKARRKNRMLYNSQFPFAHANIDRDIVGERAGLECKTTSVMNLKKFKNGEFPEQYYAQCVHYIAVTGADRWYLAVLILGREFLWFVIERDQDEIDALMNAEREFWEQYVIPDVPPPVDGLHPTTSALNAMFPNSVSEEKMIDRENVIQNWFALQKQIKALEKQRELCAQIVKGDLGNAEKGICGAYQISWALRNKKTFDTARFAADNPDVDLTPYYKISPYRAFSIKEKEVG